VVEGSAGRVAVEVWRGRAGGLFLFFFIIIFILSLDAEGRHDEEEEEEIRSADPFVARSYRLLHCG
jgi:hypothetical protein